MTGRRPLVVTRRVRITPHHTARAAIASPKPLSTQNLPTDGSLDSTFARNCSTMNPRIGVKSI